MKYTSPEMEYRILAAMDVITSSISGGNSGPVEGNDGEIILPDGDEF